MRTCRLLTYLTRGAAIALMRLLPALCLLTWVAACSLHDDVVAPPDDGSDGLAALPVLTDADGHRYVKLRIVIPHDPADDDPAITRAAGDVSESHGNLNEYEVHYAYIVLFKGSSKEHFAHYNLGDPSILEKSVLNNPNPNVAGYSVGDAFEADPSEHITSSGYLTLQVNDYTGDEELYALILLNWKGVLEESFITGSNDYDAFQKKIITQLGDATNGYFMSNVAMSRIPGGSQNPAATNYVKDGKTVTPGVVTIPEVKTIFTEATAKESDGKTVFVERAAAKVAVNASTKTSFLVNGNTANPAVVHKMEWVVDNRRNQSYALRKFDEAWLDKNDDAGFYPMVDATEVMANYGDKQDSYRTLWGTAADATSPAPSFSHLKESLPSPFDDPAFTRHVSGESEFIHENPVTTTNLRQDATRVVLRVQLKDASKALIKGTAYGIQSDEPTMTTICTTQDQLRRYIKKKEGLSDEDAATITFSTTTDADGKVIVTPGGPKLSKSYTIYQYNDQDPVTHAAYFYYERFIPHFKTPASDGLGKYGVIRNNFYNIKIDEYTNLGSPIYPKLGTGALP